MNKLNEILQYFPINISNNIAEKLSKNQHYTDQVQEIRLRANRPIILKFRNFDIVLEYIITTENLLQILERFCENSIYAYKNQICQGFLTIKGGHRVGITGTVVIEDNKIINVKYISSLNIRVAREVINCSNDILNEIIDENNRTIFNTLIVSPPGKGKTTMLRDIVRQISNGITAKNFYGLTVGLVDERGEIAATFKGIPQNDVGIRTDIIGNVDKSSGIEMLIRSMAPDVIACDEIGNVQDIRAIKKAMQSGVKGIFTMHGRTIEDVKKNVEVNFLIENKQIEKILFIQ
ncbi:MAG: stage III sporulation protein AA [Clostridia bacterium]|nr:stage III sporulation protein AA [Clostridia bacterium]